MKDDVEIRPRPPRKRRQLEAALDVELAVWIRDESLAPSERRRARDEQNRRRERTVPVVLGFSGTREGMTPQQKEAVRLAVEAEGVAEAHHGDCVGGDEQFHSLCRGAGVPVVLHPPEDGKLRAYCDGAVRSEKAKPFLERNKDIVRATSLLVACPKEGREPAPGRGQGTWSTVRYARQRGGRLWVVMPDGTVIIGTERED